MKKSVKSKKNSYYVYIIKCAGERLYTGITTDYKRRFAEHIGLKGNKKGAKFTKSFRPEIILALWTTSDRSSASKLESRIKGLSKEKKNILIADNKNFKKYFDGSLDISLYKRSKIAKI